MGWIPVCQKLPKKERFYKVWWFGVGVKKLKFRREIKNKVEYYPAFFHEDKKRKLPCVALAWWEDEKYDRK